VVLIIEFSLKSSCLHPVFGPLFTAYPLSLSEIRKVKEVSLNLGMKSRNSAFNAQGSRVIIAIVHVGAVKIYVAAVEWRLTQKERLGLNRMKLNWAQKVVHF